MSGTSGKSLTELKAMRQKLIDQGKELSTSKELGKIENAIKVLEPNKYSADQVAAAKLKLASSTETPGTNGSSSSSALGLGDLGKTGSGVDLNKIYDTAMNSADLTALRNELKTKKEAKVAAETKVNDNPFYAEATRTGKLAKVQESSQAEISNIESDIAQQEADAQVKVNIALQQYNIDDKNYQNQLQKLNLLISSGAIVNANSQNIADIALATGISTDMVRGIIQTTKQNQQKLQVATNDNGDVTIFDANTGNVVNTIKGIGNKQNGNDKATTQEKAFDSAIADGIAQLQKGEDWGTVWSRIYTKFKGIGSDADLTLAIDSGLGTSWREGGAYEAYKKKQLGE